jgi:hypothetical protein
VATGGAVGVAVALPLGHVEVGADQPVFGGGSAGGAVDVPDPVPEPVPDPVPDPAPDPVPEPDPFPEPAPDAVPAVVFRVRGGVAGFVVTDVAGAEGDSALSPVPWAGVVAAGRSVITFSVPAPADV